MNDWDPFNNSILIRIIWWETVDRAAHALSDLTSYTNKNHWWYAMMVNYCEDTDFYLGHCRYPKQLKTWCLIFALEHLICSTGLLMLFPSSNCISLLCPLFIHVSLKHQRPNNWVMYAHPWQCAVMKLVYALILFIYFYLEKLWIS